MYKNTICTVLSFQKFYITQNLREIKVGEIRVPKSAILTHLETLNFDFYEVLLFLKADKLRISEPLKLQKWHFMKFYILQH